MQLEFENPYASPAWFLDPKPLTEPKVSFRRGLYYALLWGLVVSPMPLVWLGMLILLRPDLPPPLLGKVILSRMAPAAVGMLILPIFCGLVAIANYTPPIYRGYVRTFLYVGSIFVLSGTFLGVFSQIFGGPLHIQRIYEEPSDQQYLWNLAWVCAPPLLFAGYLTWSRIKYPPIPKATLMQHGE
jgi:hypothetical protein